MNLRPALPRPLTQTTPNERSPGLVRRAMQQLNMLITRFGQLVGIVTTNTTTLATHGGEITDLDSRVTNLEAGSGGITLAALNLWAGSTNLVTAGALDVTSLDSAGAGEFGTTNGIVAIQPSVNLCGDGSAHGAYLAALGNDSLWLVASADATGGTVGIGYHDGTAWVPAVSITRTGAASTLYLMETGDGVVDCGTPLYVGTNLKLYGDSGAVGELGAGSLIQTGGWLGLSGYTAGAASGVQIIYHDGTQWRQAVGIANSSGWGSLILMYTGGDVRIGTNNPASSDVDGRLCVRNSMRIDVQEAATIPGDDGLAGEFTWGSNAGTGLNEWMVCGADLVWRRAILHPYTITPQTATVNVRLADGTTGRMYFTEGVLSGWTIP